MVDRRISEAPTVRWKIEWDLTNGPYQRSCDRAIRILRFFRGPWTVGPTVGDFLEQYDILSIFQPSTGRNRQPKLLWKPRIGTLGAAGPGNVQVNGAWGLSPPSPFFEPTKKKRENMGGSSTFLKCWNHHPGYNILQLVASSSDCCYCCYLYRHQIYKNIFCHLSYRSLVLQIYSNGIQ